MAKASAKQLAWRKEFARRFGVKKSKPRGSSMASSKSNGNGKKQGIVSWATSVIALIIALANPVARISEAYHMPKGIVGGKLGHLARTLTSDYTGMQFKPDWTYVGWIPSGMARGYAPLATAVAFKKSTTYLAKIAPIKSLIPRIGM